MPSFKEEHILIIAPGSKTILAQLGLPESFGPPALRIPTRVFPTKDGQYHPNKVRSKTVKVKRPVVVRNGGLNGASNGDGDQQMTGVDTAANGIAPTTDAAQPVPGEVEEEVTQYEEDIDDEEGALFPIVRGQIVHHEALQALFYHIELLVSPPMHTPVLMVCDPSWTQFDKEMITQFYFEKLQRPAVSFVSSPLAVCGGFGATEACVIDIGYEKTVVSSVLGFNAVEEGTVVLGGVGGQSMNNSMAGARKEALRTHKVKGPQFTQSMVEQLKRQPYICEILQPDVPLPEDEPAPPEAPGANPAAAASTGVDGEKGAAASSSAGLPRGPGSGTQTGAEGEGGDNDGVLDVASIVASGKASEILAKREQEKAEKAPRGGNKKGPSEPTKAVRLANAQKARVAFRYTERVKARELHAAGSVVNREGGKEEGGRAEANESGAEEATGDAQGAELTVGGDPPTVAGGVAGGRKDEATTGSEQNESYVYANREIEVGVERFAGCDTDTFLAPLSVAVVDAIAGAPPDKRQDLWNNLIIVGNGSKVKGLKERIVMHLVQTCMVSPNNNTMFTSELPSQLSTPLATGANTPQPGHGRHGAATPTPGGGNSAVNPLLLAATTASQAQNQHSQLAPPGQPFQASMQPATPGQNPAMGGFAAPSLPHMPMHSPTTIKIVPPKDYYPEWKDHGFEEAVFLGACVMARVNFIMDQSQPASFMTRVQYNEEGPGGVHHYLLG